MTFVLDASSTLAWHFADEHDISSRALAGRATVEGAHVPAHWATEIANALLMGERRGCTTSEAIEGFSERLELLPLEWTGSIFGQPFTACCRWHGSIG